MMRADVGSGGRLIAALLLLLSGCDHASPDGAAQAAAKDAPPLSREVVLSGLHLPWDLAFTPDGAMLFTEKCRGLSVRRADGSVQLLFGSAGAAVPAATARRSACPGRARCA